MSNLIRATMKKIFLLFALILPCLYIFGQPIIPKGSYQFTESIIQDFSEMKVKDSIENIEIYNNYKVVVVGQSIDLSTTYFKYWNFPKLIKEKNDKGIEIIGPNPKAIIYNGKIFELPTNVFDKITRPLYSRYKGTAVGVYTVPFRLRGVNGNFDFESSLSLQANLVAGFGSIYKDYSYADFSIGIGLTSVKLTPINSLVLDDRTASAFTVSTGVILKPSKYANLGLFVGVDNLGASDRDVNWIYNGKVWYGVGINISFNSITTDQTSKVGNN